MTTSGSIPAICATPHPAISSAIRDIWERLPLPARELVNLEVRWLAEDGTFPGATVDDRKRGCEILTLTVPGEVLPYPQAEADNLAGQDEESRLYLFPLDEQEQYQVMLRITTDQPDFLLTDDQNSRISSATQAAFACISAARFPFLSLTSRIAQDIDWETLPLAGRRRLMHGILGGRRPSAGFRLLDAWGGMDYFLPEITAGKGLLQNRFHAHDIYEHLLHACDGATEYNLSIRWSALLHDIGKVPTRKVLPTGEASFHNHEMVSAKQVVPIMKRLGIPRELGQKVRFLVRNHMFHYTDEWTDRAIRRFVNRVPLDDLQDLISLRMADRKGSGKKSSFPVALQKLIRHIDEVRRKEAEFKISDLQISGRDLIALGMEPGPQMGIVLRELLNEVVAGVLANERVPLLERAQALTQPASLHD